MLEIRTEKYNSLLSGRGKERNNEGLDKMGWEKNQLTNLLLRRFGACSTYSMPATSCRGIRLGVSSVVW